MRIGIVGPSEDEIMPFIECIENKEVDNFARLKFYSGNYGKVDVVALYCGVCKVNAAIATQVLIDKFAVTHIIITGVAGGIDERLNVCDTVISTEVAYHDVDEAILTEYHPWMENIYFKADNKMLSICEDIIKKNKFNQKVVLGRMVTGEAFITKEGRTEIVSKYNPLCVDMETGGIAHVCYANKIPFIAIRSITDTEGDCGIEVFEENCSKASHNSIDVLKKWLESINSMI
ncbi:5'-methylthioadenosine/adenosylhomocysteine nucleosidase [Clostridium sardiniense]|uniref:5'-methylthioadenosine/adenosylhomocysteine nucleosidase n=1 Tax=Clostridium sardiniense TaxID=29369 RepID=UPI003D33198C